jgi:hypothetical protein
MRTQPEGWKALDSNTRSSALELSAAAEQPGGTWIKTGETPHCAVRQSSIGSSSLWLLLLVCMRSSLGTHRILGCCFSQGLYGAPQGLREHGLELNMSSNAIVRNENLSIGRSFPKELDINFANTSELLLSSTSNFLSVKSTFMGLLTSR